jgi:hypothetical protein
MGKWEIEDELALEFEILADGWQCGESIVRSTNKKTRQKDYLEKELDALARTRCFERDGHKCVVQGCTRTNIQWCHVISRTYKSIQWDLDNNLTMCAGHHLAWHQDPREWGKWFAENYPARDEYLTIRKRLKMKIDRKELLIALRIAVGRNCNG